MATLGRCDRRLGQYRHALDEGADPAVVTKWIDDIQTERASAERVPAANEVVPALSVDDVRRMADAVEEKVMGMLAGADPPTKAALYAGLGITLRYQHDRRVVTVEARPATPCANERVGGRA